MHPFNLIAHSLFLNRKYKIFSKRLKRYKGRRDNEKVEATLKDKPVYNFDHMVKG